MIPSGSPDIDAWLCYAVVVALGLILGVRQVNQKIAIGYIGKWTVPHTWLLLLAYISIPVGLFFLLDRTGAIQDTSLFAAIIVAVTYDYILSGESRDQDKDAGGAFKAPVQLASWWPSFQSWVDEVAKKIVQKEVRREQRFVEYIVDLVSDPQKDDKFQKLHQLALTELGSVQEMEEELQQIATQAQQYNLPPRVMRERQASCILNYVQSLSDFQYKLKKEGIINQGKYFCHVRGGGLAFGAGIASLLVVVILLAWHLSAPSQRLSYYAWRLRKPNSTALDQYRCRKYLLTAINDPQSADEVLKRLVDLVQRPDLPLERATQVLHLLLQSKILLSDRQSLLQEYLLAALRTPNGNIRARLHETLLHLATHWGAVIHQQELKNWRPGEGDSPVEIEAYIKTWQTVFQKTRTGEIKK